MYNQILKTIEDKIGTSYPSMVDELKQIISTGSTGGEITGMVGHYLKHLNVNNPKAHKVLKDDIAEFLKKCDKIGLSIR